MSVGGCWWWVVGGAAVVVGGVGDLICLRYFLYI